MNDDERTLMLLQIIRINGNTEYLLKMDFTLTEISTRIGSLFQDGVIRQTNEGIELTRDGELFFQKLNRKLGRRGLYKYFSVDSVSKDIPYPIESVYVPNKRVKSMKRT